MDENVIKNLKSESRWLRLLFMVFFGTVGVFATWLIMALAAIQAAHGFVKGVGNQRLMAFTEGLNRFVFQIAQFLTYNSDDKPYPFSDWPDADNDSDNQDVSDTTQ